MKKALIALLIITLSGPVSASNGRTIAYSLDQSISIDLPHGWAYENKFDAPNIKLAIQSPYENEKDIFGENIVIAANELYPGQTLRDFIDNVNERQKSIRPDYTILDESEVVIDGHHAVRQVVLMTFPEFVSKNIQNIFVYDGVVYQITASIPEKEFDRWQPLMDDLAQSVKLNK